MKKIILISLAFIVTIFLMGICVLSGHVFGLMGIPVGFILSFLYGRFVIAPMIYEALHG